MAPYALKKDRTPYFANFGYSDGHILPTKNRNPYESSGIPLIQIMKYDQMGEICNFDFDPSPFI